MPNEKRLSPGAIPADDLARALAALGAHVTVENLVHYAAWLAKHARRSIGEGGETRLAD